jgi:hypothetical protein
MEDMNEHTGQKKCSRCGEEKDLSEFYKDKSKPDGHESLCKKCRYTKKNQEENIWFDSNTKKRCIKCGLVKDIGKFYKSKNRKNELDCYCIECVNESGKQWYKDNHDKVQKKHKQWAENNREKMKQMSYEWIKNNYLRHLITKCIIRAKKKDIQSDSIDILLEYLTPIYEQGICQKCNKKIIARDKSHKNSPSIDRIKPEFGYIVGNVTILCCECNRKKQDNTLEDFKSWINWLEQINNNCKIS